MIRLLTIGSFLLYSTLGMSIDDFPNPTQFPERCGNSESLMLCDPLRKIARNSDRLLINSAIMDVMNSGEFECSDGSIKKARIGVAIADRITGSTNIAGLADDILAKWRIGDPGCQNGMLLLLATEQKGAHLSTARNVKKVLSDETIEEEVFPYMTPFFKRKEYTQGIVTGLGKIGEHLNNPPSSMFGFFVFILIIVGIIVCCMINKRLKEQRDQRRSAEALERVMRDLQSEAVLAPASDEQIARNGCCPICLEDFDVSGNPPASVFTGASAPPAAGGDSYDNNISEPLHRGRSTSANNRDSNDRRANDSTHSNAAPRILRCGHVFHGDCISEWLDRDHDRCPLCRQNVRAEHPPPPPHGCPPDAGTGTRGPGSSESRRDDYSTRARFYTSRLQVLYPAIGVGILDYLMQPVQRNSSFFDGSSSRFEPVSSEETREVARRMFEESRQIVQRANANVQSNTNQWRNNPNQQHFGGAHYDSDDKKDFGGATSSW